MKKYSKNKIEADDLIKQVRQRIKETTWEKQNLREGFNETFRPLISQFEEPEYIENPEGAEKPKIPKKKNIFSQNQEMLQNQLALTEGLKANQKAITDGLSKVNRLIEAKDKIDQLENLADMQELPGIEDEEDDQAQAPPPKEDKTQSPPPKEDKAQFIITKDYFDRFLINKEAQDTLKSNAYFELPSEYFDKDINEIGSRLDNVNSDLQDLGDKIKGKVDFLSNQEGYQFAVSTAKKRGPNPETKQQINNFNTLSIYGKNLSDLMQFKKLEKTGSGLFSNPEELLHRFELLSGSLAAGNNGVLPEYIQIAHRLRDLGILSNNQLNTLLRKVI